MATTNLVYMKKLPKFEYLAPKTVDEACSLLAQHKGKARVIEVNPLKREVLFELDSGEREKLAYE